MDLIGQVMQLYERSEPKDVKTSSKVLNNIAFNTITCVLEHTVGYSNGLLHDKTLELIQKYKPTSEIQTQIIEDALANFESSYIARTQHKLLFDFVDRTLNDIDRTWDDYKNATETFTRIVSECDLSIKTLSQYTKLECICEHTCRYDIPYDHQDNYLYCCMYEQSFKIYKKDELHTFSLHITQCLVSIRNRLISEQKHMINYTKIHEVVSIQLRFIEALIGTRLGV